MHKKYNKGFSLVELSVVIVLIGLIAASVVGARNLIEASKINTQIADFKKFKTAYDSFKLQFNALPGDFSKASQYWGASIPNGDGNGTTGTGDDSASNPNSENIIFFYHLSLANMIPESYTNVFVLDQGYPSLKISPSKGMTAGGRIPGNVGYQQSVLAQFVSALEINVGQPTAGGCCAYNNNVGTSNAETYRAIDLKIDDGMASDGIFQAYKVWSSFYGDRLTAVDGDYLLTNTQPACQAVYVLEE